MDQELKQIEASRALRLGPDPQRTPAKSSLIGLAFSGGGIRSATFNLGVLHALAQARLLRAFDYLSSVSGGGYIGGWLMAWMHHAQQGIRAIEEQLAPHPYSISVPADPPPVRFLRNYDNYLTPRKGILSADFWAFVASYLRNTLLNLIILLLSLLALLLAPRAIMYLAHMLEAEEDEWQWKIPFDGLLHSQGSALSLGFVLGLVAVVFMGLNLAWVVPLKGRTYPSYTKQWAIQSFIVAPLFLSAALLSYGLSHYLTDWGVVHTPMLRAPILGIAFYFSMWVGAFLVRWIVQAKKGTCEQVGPARWLVLLTALVTGALAGYLFVPYANVLGAPESPGALRFDLWHIFTFGTPALVGMMLLAGVVHIGLMGRGMADAHREWWARLGGWLSIYSIWWLLLFLMAIYVPVGLTRLWVNPFHQKFTFTAGTLIWAVSTLYGILFGKSEHTSRLLPDAPVSKKILGYLARATPYIFILGLLAGLSVLAAKIAADLAGDTQPLQAVPSDIVDQSVPLACLVFFLAAVVLSWRVDINEFSVHHLYRNRLVRCYLGASVPGRDAQPFTGFSDEDDLPLASLKIPPDSTDPRDARPIPILNASLNVVRGKELALQTRKARSFTFTPLCSGFSRAAPLEAKREAAYAPTEDAGSKRPGNGGGVSLGTAVAISGAAASPNMGFHSSPSLAFLMTLFDVRLGWWIGNPLRGKWNEGSPRVGFYWLLRELLGSASDESDYVYLSDGGHFENLAVYELVRRGCRLIVASDASCDPGYSFEDLHNAIERCRADFGVEIALDTSALKPQKGLAGSHFAVGKIHYTQGSPDDDGVIIYLKPNLLSGDSPDLLGYLAINSHFPHDSTANQWFDETHFENYRALGNAIGAAVSEQISCEMHRLLA